MKIVPANETHIPGMLRLLLQVGQVHREIRPDIFRDGAQKYDEAALKELLKDPARPIFIAETDGQVLGYCFCIHKQYTGDPVLADRKELYIDDLCVEESCRNMGIATALYRHVTEYAKNQGYGFITLNVWAGNDNAQKFYEHLGFTVRNTHMESKLC